MKKLLCMTLVLCCLAGVSYAKTAFDNLAARIYSDGEIIQGGIGWTDTVSMPGMIGDRDVEYGVVGRWHEDDPTNLNAAGVYGLLLVDPNIVVPLRKLVPYVGDWLQLPETISGRASVGVTILAANFQDDVDAVVAPVLSIQIGSLCLWTEYDWVGDGGGKPGATESEARVMLGLCIRR